MTTKSSKKNRPTRSSSHKEKVGFSIAISTDTQVALSKAIILALVVIAMIFLAYYKIYEPVVWSSLMTIASYVAFANPRNNTNQHNR